MNSEPPTPRISTSWSGFERSCIVDAIRFEEEARLRSKVLHKPGMSAAAEELRGIAKELRSLAEMFAAWPKLAEAGEGERLGIERAELPPRLLALLRAGEEILARTR